MPVSISQVEPSGDCQSDQTQQSSLSLPNINMAWFENVAKVEYLALEPSGERWSQVVSAGAEW